MSYAGDITPEQAWAILRDDPNATLIDVRTDAEWRFVGLPDLTELAREVICIEWVHSDGSPNLNFARELTSRVSAGPAVFLCRSGNRSIPAAATGTAAGLNPSYNVLDGFEGNLDEHGHRGGTGWKAVGLPWTQS
ncbi:rhodanese-like domain-containing protein [Mycolicibacter sp. MYC123]|uniref:Rhodanese-like domain-containing protein n=1 Tax=[Mycobacterium] zoologicum TaxID=2872311 RepID=A0ABU5YJH8_9MYCO|nr:MULTISPECIES: rhodanese-like domain-containing protein [unclassified Mycolicibacter]MEB3050040.1 rhodanese-like domain-containing protein [Mycolicibacter sp. MYC123]MEB3062404.1 rhodanese-like domain-containing protein [Mycolicibacter sp. MYC101]